MPNLNTKIGLEIHVQLKTKSKMFCGCDNNAEGKAPNTVVCPVCLGLPGTLPVANKQAIESTIKTGLVLNCEIAKISKFDRKHYFYPDLPKGYQISQYDEPFCIGGYLETDGDKIRLNRIHLEEDAGKLTHKGSKSLVDLNRAGTPLMEIVTEPDLTSAKQAGDFLRKLQGIVRDQAQVSEAGMEKGHMRCDANISVNDGDKMSPIVELKNINSFRFVEKALTLVEEKLKNSYNEWPAKNSKETWGYNSENNTVYLQRRKEEAADYRYFPEPDLPPIDTAMFDLEALKSSVGISAEDAIEQIIAEGVSESDAKVLSTDKNKFGLYTEVRANIDKKYLHILAKALVQNYFGFDFPPADSAKYIKLIADLGEGKISKSQFTALASKIRDGANYEDLETDVSSSSLSEDDLKLIISDIITKNPSEADRYHNGELQLFGFFMGQIMKVTAGKANPQMINKVLKETL